VNWLGLTYTMEKLYVPSNHPKDMTDTSQQLRDAKDDVETHKKRLADGEQRLETEKVSHRAERIKAGPNQ